MTVLLGIAALSLDVSFMYDKRNRLHAAADAAAKSAAFEVKRNSLISLTDLQRFANQQVSAHGFNPAETTSVVVHRPPHPPTRSEFINAGYVEVIVSEPTSTFFGKILGWASLTPGARAVAGTSNNLACIITLGPSPASPHSSLEIGNSVLTLNGCGVAAGGDLRGTNPNAAIVGTPSPSVGIVGSCFDTCGAMGVLTTGAPPPSDPLAGLAPPPQIGVGCPPGIPGPGVLATLNPGCYTSIASSVTQLTAGNYYVTGPVTIGNNGNLTGTGVMIYLTGPGGQITSGNNAGLHLSAPTSGPYTGIAIFQDPSDTLNFDTGNHFTLDVTGAIYMPGADVDIANHLTFTSTTCTLFIAHSLDIRNGDGSMNNAGCATTFDGAAFLSVSIAE